jgi:hypothetical protein
VSGGFVERVTAMARELGFTQLDVRPGECVCIKVEGEGGSRPVDVFVRPCGEMHGKEVLEFASAGLRLPEDDATKMPLLILALQRNADVILGHWGLDEDELGSTLRVFHSQITETMDLPELRGAVLAVADEYGTLADAFEGVLGRLHR